MENAIKVLIIDDDEDCRISIRSLPEAEGFEVASAACGREGLQLARALHPDLIKHCQEYEGCQDTPIIMCSSIQNSPDELYPRAEEVGMIRPDAYLAKPLDLEQLLATSRRLVRRPAHA